MPFFYSQHLRDDQRPMLEAATTMKATNATAHANPITGLPRRHRHTWHPRAGAGAPAGAGGGDAARRGGRLVWHSNVGASGRRYRPLAPGPRRSKAVRFSTVEVREFSFDWSHAGDVFYSRAELTALGQERFDDAAALRDGREDRGHARRPSMDDADLSTRPRDVDVAALLSLALEPDARDGEASIRGIEHFVYPPLQQEMIRRKRELKREVLEFARSGCPDPQGWRLAERSRLLSSWARGVAAEKGLRDAAVDPHRAPGADTSEGIRKSRDELEQEARTIRGSASCVALDELEQEALAIRGSASCVALDEAASEVSAWLSARSHDELDESARPWVGRPGPGRAPTMRSGADGGERGECRGGKPPCPPSPSSPGRDDRADGGEGHKGTPPRSPARPSWMGIRRSPRGRPRGADSGGGSRCASPSPLTSKSCDELGGGGLPPRLPARESPMRGGGAEGGESPGGTLPRIPARPSWMGWTARSPRARRRGADEDGRSGVASQDAQLLLSSKSYDELDQSARPWRRGPGGAGREEAGVNVPDGDGGEAAFVTPATSAPDAVSKVPLDVAAGHNDDSTGSREAQPAGASTAEK